MKKSEEVKKYIADLVEKGKLKNGSRLPSCREAAAILAINKITVNRAYRELEEEHKVYSIQRGGFYLADFELESEQEKLALDLANPDILKGDPGFSPRAQERLKEIDELLHVKYARWEELEALKNELQ